MSFSSTNAENQEQLRQKQLKEQLEKEQTE
jgi:hypothetical protein